MTNQSRDTNVHRIQEDYITQVSEEIEKRVTKKSSQELCSKKSRILGVLSQLDESLLDPQVRVHSRPVPEVIREFLWSNPGNI